MISQKQQHWFKRILTFGPFKGARYTAHAYICLYTIENKLVTLDYRYFFLLQILPIE